jgi:hypothetical protein
MNTKETTEVADIVGRIQFWPASMRIALARCILETLEAPAAAPSAMRPRGMSAAEVAAMFKTDKPAPDDATIRQWIHAHRMEKYGQ